MREHGLLNRLLLIYQEHLRRISGRPDFDSQVLSDAVGIMQKFVENDRNQAIDEDDPGIWAKNDFTARLISGALRIAEMTATPFAPA